VPPAVWGISAVAAVLMLVLEESRKALARINRVRPSAAGLEVGSGLAASSIDRSPTRPK
jgi:hypothetical protein